MGKKRRPALLEQEDEDYQDGFWVPNEEMNNAMDVVDALDTMTDFLKVQHQAAIDLTKLVLEHCKFENITERKIFDIYHQSVCQLKMDVKNLMK